MHSIMTISTYKKSHFCICNLVKGNNVSCLAVIPARGGSKGIPRKNMRLLDGKPLIAYAIENALNCEYITDVVVSSDSEEILSFASTYENVIPLPRPGQLAHDTITLDPVVYDALIQQENKGGKYDMIVTLQPTSPLLEVRTLNTAFEYFFSIEADSLISVVNAPHLSWTLDNEGVPVPTYEERLNRQLLPPQFKETGAFLISKREAVSEHDRLGRKVTIFEVPEEQATDIDTIQDWIICETFLKKKIIVFRVDGYKKLGLGHVFRALTLAYELMGHDVIFICNSNHVLGIEKLKSAHMHIVEIKNDEELLRWLDDNKVDIFINDLLDTSIEYVNSIKARVDRFVSFEDMGEGARQADAVINALYEGATPHHNTFQGKAYVCLRDEFQAARPSIYHDNVSRVLVSFGGTDPLDLTARLYGIAQKLNQNEVIVEFDFVLGPGYTNSSIIPIPDKGIFVNKNLVRLSDHMRKADLALSSQGRTTFELASMGVPTIVLAENPREQLHTFAQMDNGFINLGLGSEVTDEDIESALVWLKDATSVRREMRNRMLANDLKSGISRVKRIILGETL